MGELEQLIKEQERELRAKNKAYRETGTVWSLDWNVGDEGLDSWTTLLDSDSELHPSFPLRMQPCAVHGFKELKIIESSGAKYCQACHRERQYTRYKTDSAYRERRLGDLRKKYAENVEFREHRKALSREYQAKRRQDPEWVIADRERQARQRAKKRHGL